MRARRAPVSSSLSAWLTRACTKAKRPARPGASATSAAAEAASSTSRAASSSTAATRASTSTSNSRPMMAAARSRRSASRPSRATRPLTTSWMLSGSSSAARLVAAVQRPALSRSIAPDSARCRTISPRKNGLPPVSRLSSWANARAAVVERVAGRGLEQGLGLLRAQAREREALDAGLAPQVGEQLGQRCARRPRLAVGGHHQQRHRGRRPVQVADERERRARGPVQVVEDEQDRAVGGAAVQQLDRGAEEQVALGLGVGRAGATGCRRTRTRAGGRAGRARRRARPRGRGAGPRARCRPGARAPPARAGRARRTRRRSGRRARSRRRRGPRARAPPPDGSCRCPAPRIRAPARPSPLRAAAQAAASCSRSATRPTKPDSPASRRRGGSGGVPASGARRSHSTLHAVTVSGSPLSSIGPSGLMAGASGAAVRRCTASVTRICPPSAAAHSRAASTAGCPNQSSASRVASPIATPDAQHERRRRGPVAALEPLLHRDGAAQRGPDTLERDHDAVAERLDLVAAGGPDGLAQDPEVLAPQGVALVGREARLQRRRTDEVGEQ